MAGWELLGKEEKKAINRIERTANLKITSIRRL